MFFILQLDRARTTFQLQKRKKRHLFISITLLILQRNPHSSSATSFSFGLNNLWFSSPTTVLHVSVIVCDNIKLKSGDSFCQLSTHFKLDMNNILKRHFFLIYTQENWSQRFVFVKPQGEWVTSSPFLSRLKSASFFNLLSTN